MAANARKVLYNDVDISFNPNDTDAVASVEGEETSTRRKATVDLVWRDLTFAVPKKATKEDKKKQNEAEQPAKQNIDANDLKPSAADEPTDLNDSQPSDTGASSSGAHSSPNTKVILHGVSGYVRPGTMLAVMGSSGAGKTSLLNLLAGRINSSKGANATGEVLVNGQPRDYNTFKKLSAYVLQDDDMFAELTVEEQITYAALLRLPASMPRDKKMLRVNRVIQELGLSKVRNTMVGNELIRGISGGERKRVNIGTELVTDPSLLFLDECTTGLDSFNALNVMQSLRHLASNGRTIVSTIHQPRSSIFALFDQLCLLSEGRVMYFGPAKDAVTYFSGLDFHSPLNFNPADFFLDLLSIDPRSAEKEVATKNRVKYLGDKFDEQEAPVQPLLATSDIESQSNLTKKDVEDVAADDSGFPEAVEFNKRDYQTSWLNEFVVLCNRSLKLAFREKAANIARLLQTLFFAIMLGLIWLDKGRNDVDLGSQRSLEGILFFIVINQAFGGVFAVIFGFPLERSIVVRERGSASYRTSSYFVSKTFTDIPKSFFFNTLFAVIVYWMVGFRANAGAFIIFVITVFFTSLLAESLALSVSILAGDAQAAAAIIPVFVIIALLFGGFFINDDELADWIGWLKYTSFVFYAFTTLVKNEFVGDSETVKTILAGYNDLSLTVNIIILIGICVFYRVLGYLFLHYLRGPKFLKF